MKHRRRSTRGEAKDSEHVRISASSFADEVAHSARLGAPRWSVSASSR